MEEIRQEASDNINNIISKLNSVESHLKMFQETANPAETLFKNLNVAEKAELKVLFCFALNTLAFGNYEEPSMRVYEGSYGPNDQY